MQNDDSRCEDGLSVPADRLIKTYAAKRTRIWWIGILMVGLGALGLYAAKQVVDWWFGGGPVPDPRLFAGILCLIGFPVGLVFILDTIRGLPRLTLSASGISLYGTMASKQADWNSITPFTIQAVGNRFGKPVLTASARIIGPNAKLGWSRSRTFPLANMFEPELKDIVAAANELRARALGTCEPPADSPSPLGQQLSHVSWSPWKVPWLTLILLGVLVGIYALEITFGVGPNKTLEPTTRTLVGMGGVLRSLVLDDYQWYRLFTAPFLHADGIHIFANGISLLLAGWFLERLIGRLWFFASFIVGALGGSLVSLAMSAPKNVYVGASGALMGLFAVLLVTSFRLDPSKRGLLQGQAFNVLLPSVVPVFYTTGSHIDYAAHLGGAIAGALLGFLLLRNWPATEPMPQLRRLAGWITGIGLTLIVLSGGFVAAAYPYFLAAVRARG